MAFRAITLLGVVVSCFCVLGIAPVARAEDTNYRLELRPVGSQNADTMVISCMEDTLCQGQINLPIYEKLQTVTVVALIQSGNAYFKFSVEKVTLFSGSQPYIHVPVGPSQSARMTTTLQEPPLALLKDWPNSQLLRPIIRVAPVIATIDIHIERATD